MDPGHPSSVQSLVNDIKPVLEIYNYTDEQIYHLCKRAEFNREKVAMIVNQLVEDNTSGSRNEQWSDVLSKKQRKEKKDREKEEQRLLFEKQEILLREDRERQQKEEMERLEEERKKEKKPVFQQKSFRKDRILEKPKREFRFRKRQKEPEVEQFEGQVYDERQDNRLKYAYGLKDEAQKNFETTDVHTKELDKPKKFHPQVQPKRRMKKEKEETEEDYEERRLRVLPKRERKRQETFESRMYHSTEEKRKKKRGKGKGKGDRDKDWYWKPYGDQQWRVKQFNNYEAISVREMLEPRKELEEGEKKEEQEKPTDVSSTISQLDEKRFAPEERIPPVKEDETYSPPFDDKYDYYRQFPRYPPQIDYRVDFQYPREFMRIPPIQQMNGMQQMQPIQIQQMQQIPQQMQQQIPQQISPQIPQQQHEYYCRPSMMQMQTPPRVDSQMNLRYSPWQQNSYFGSFRHQRPEYFYTRSPYENDRPRVD